jgi:hypothetical protein
MVALQHLLATSLIGFLPNMTTFPTGIFDKIGFDLDYIGRARQIAFIEETARSTYNRNGTEVNIAVWNMHIRQDHYFDDDILETGLLPMGAGGGFVVVVFTGKGFLRNENEVAAHNWLVSGKVVVEGNVARWRAVGGCEGVWGCMKATYDSWMQQPIVT